MTWNRRRISSSLNTYGGGRWGAFTRVSVAGAHACPPNGRGGWGRGRREVCPRHAGERRRRPRRPAELAGVFGQVTQDDLLAADGGRLEMAAVEKFLDGFFDDRAVRIAFPAGVLGELAQHPLLAVGREPAGAACRDQRVDQVRKRQRVHGRAPCAALRTSSTSRQQPRRCSVSSLRECAAGVLAAARPRPAVTPGGGVSVWSIATAKAPRSE